MLSLVRMPLPRTFPGMSSVSSVLTSFRSCRFTVGCCRVGALSASAVVRQIGALFSLPASIKSKMRLCRAWFLRCIRLLSCVMVS